MRHKRRVDLMLVVGVGVEVVLVTGKRQKIDAYRIGEAVKAAIQAVEVVSLVLPRNTRRFEL